MSKRFKFSEPLPSLVLQGKKDTTWRINDEKSVETGDNLSLCYKDGNEFAKGKVIGTKDTTFGNLTFEDKEGHEKFESEEKMYKTYSRYYSMSVIPETKLKVIKFRLL